MFRFLSLASSLAIIRAICLLIMAYSLSIAPTSEAGELSYVFSAGSLPLRVCFRTVCCLVFLCLLGPGLSEFRRGLGSMRLVVVVGVGGVLVVCSASGDACKRRSAASTCNSITAYTSRVGAMLRGYRFAMSAILIFSASTAFSTRYVSFISSAFGKCVDFFGYAWVRADTFCSYCSTATLIFESTFFRTSSSLIPSFAYKLDSVMMTAFCFPPLVTPCSGRSKLSSVVNATI
jgi:hypothetical protein